MDTTNRISLKVDIKKVILAMTLVLALVLLINFLYVSFSQALIIGGGGSGCTTCCTNECSSGQKRCVNSSTYQTCGNYDSDSCLEWGSSATCSGSTSCGYGSCASNQRPNWYCSAGNCAYSCFNDSSCQQQTVTCPASSCIGTTYRQYTLSGSSCTYHDYSCSGNCFHCGDGRCECGENSSTCSSDCGGQYTPPCTNCSNPCTNCGPTCTNECTQGQKQCVDSNHYKTCGNYDSDSCWEWSTPTTCPEDQCIGSTLRHYYCNCTSNCGSGCTYTDTANSSTCGYTNPVNITCYASPNTANVGQTVYFVASATGGTGSYSYSWSGACIGTSLTCSNAFTASGTQTATIYVTSGNQNASAICSANINQTCQCCSWGSWQNQGCGSGGCGSNQMYQIRYRSCTPSACDTQQETQCVYDSSCVPQCTNECSYSGLTECYNGNSRRTCGNYDSDSCLEWGTTQTCSGDTSCGYGTCSDNQKPQWYCSNGSCTYTCYNDSNCGCNNNCCGNNCNTYLGCYDNDVYWLNYLGQPQNRYQDCGDNSCDNFANPYCLNGDVYRQRTCYTRGCSGSSCYSSSNTEQQLYQDCGTNQACQNGQCVNQCECTTGPCCDGCHYKTTAAICDTESSVEYGCPWGTGCGSDLGKRIQTRYKYCSGYNATCSGNWGSWGNWTTWLAAEYCSNSSVCSASSQKCVYSSSCVAPSLVKGCYNNDVYWFDIYGTRKNKYKTCSDDNSCTTDGCTDGKCTNLLKCDGTTCAIESKDYCDNCSHCGDGKCNCEETSCGCPSDCKTSSLSLSLLGKKSGSTFDWQKVIDANPQETIQFMLIVSNGGDASLDNVLVTASLPSEITYNNDAKVDGTAVFGDIRSGVTISQLPTKIIRTITFSGKIAKAGLIDVSRTDLGFTAQASAKNLAANDSLRITLASRSNIGVASVADILRGWLVWIAVILIAIVLVIIGIFYLMYWIIQKRRKHQVLFQKQEVTLR